MAQQATPKVTAGDGHDAAGEIAGVVPPRYLGTNTPTTIPNIKRPYALAGDFEPDDGYALRDGDVYFSHHQQAYFYVRMDGTHERCWLSTPEWKRPGTVEPLPDESRAWYQEFEPVEIIASGVPTVESAWFLTPTIESPVNQDDTPDTTNPLSWERVRSRNEVNRFLSHPLVGHERGSVTGWKACFGARYGGDLVAVAILSRPSARHADDGNRIELSRFASHPLHPPNVGTWLLAKAKEWAALAGYGKLLSYAGVAGNEGTLYHASGLREQTKTVAANGSGWGNRGGRDTWGDYERRKFTESLADTSMLKPSECDESATDPAQQGTLGRFGIGETPGPFPIKRLTAIHGEMDAEQRQFFDRHSSRSNVGTLADSNVGVLTARSPTDGETVASCILVDGKTIHTAPEGSLVTVAYAHHDEALTAPVNTGAWLLGAARDWATLEGYESVIATPRSDAHDAARKRCGIERIVDT